MGGRAGKKGQPHQEKERLVMACDLKNISLYLQIISIFMAIIAVALPALIAIVGYVYIRNFTDRMDNLSDQVDQLWDFREEQGHV